VSGERTSEGKRHGGGQARRPPAGRRTVPTELAAMAAGVTEATIRKWASRGKLSRYGRPGRAEYDVQELIEIVASRDDAVGRRMPRGR
jgi:hypothetical protein